MRKKVKLFPWIIFFILFMFVFLAWAEDYLKLIGQDWHARVVKGDEVSLLESGANYPCYLKATGWKILSKRREKMGIFGDLFIKWGWKAVVHNPGKKPIQFSIKVELISNEALVLDYDTLGKDFPGKLFTLNEQIEWIHPGKTRVFRGVSQYNASAHKGEGKPNYISCQVICK